MRFDNFGRLDICEGRRARKQLLIVAGKNLKDCSGLLYLCSCYHHHRSAGWDKCGVIPTQSLLHDHSISLELVELTGRTVGALIHHLAKPTVPLDEAVEVCFSDATFSSGMLAVKPRPSASPKRRPSSCASRIGANGKRPSTLHSSVRYPSHLSMASSIY